MAYARTPYNFVPLPEQIHKGEKVPDASRFHAKRHTGWFQVDYEALTPIYARAAWPVQGLPTPVEEVGPADRRQSADFFHQDSNRTPVLPGSSLRGMIRSVFEIMTCSRLEFFSDRRLFYRSFAASSSLRGWRDYYNQAFDVARLVAGVIDDIDGEWVLKVAYVCTSAATPASRRGFVAVPVSAPGLPRIAARYQFIAGAVSLGTTDVSLLRGTHQFEVLCGTWAPRVPGAQSGWLIVPGPDVQPRHYYQFVLDPASGPCSAYRIPADVVRDYLTWGDLAHGRRFGSSGRAPRKLGPGQPAFALVDGGEVQVIGANMMMPLRYQQSIRNVVDRSGPAPSSDPDMAQAVFGYVPSPSADAATAIKGRVFVEDARTAAPAPWLASEPADTGVRTPAVLSSPKPTSFQTYLVQDDGGERYHWDTRDSGQPVSRVRGFKRYWHRSPDAARACLRPESPEPGDTQSTRIRPVREGVRFTGRIRFENLSDGELGALYAAIRLPDGLAHKFGMGKSLGLGSLRVTVTSIALMDPRTRYTSLTAPGLNDNATTHSKLQTAYQAFVGYVAGKGQSLWAGPRMQALAALLAWDQRPADELTCMVGVDNDPQRQWKDRVVLPGARNVVPPSRLVGVRDVFSVDDSVDEDVLQGCQVTRKVRRSSFEVVIQHDEEVIATLPQSEWTTAHLDKEWKPAQMQALLRKSGIRATVMTRMVGGKRTVVAVRPED
ncbi:MAG: TIGR03986 family CRISPR-associated RAMP protein [Candidatus Latescibacterota bacterium]